jgi:uncharacterized protein (DUF1499 family)
MIQSTDAPSWQKPLRSQRFTLWAAGLVVLLALGGAVLAGADVLPKVTGFMIVLLGAVVALIGTLAGAFGLLKGWRTGRKLAIPFLIGFLTCAGFAGFVISLAVNARSVPAIHDVTTDIANPPVFSTLTLAADNLRGVETEENWRALHSAAYADLKPLVSPLTVAEATARAESIAKKEGWVIAKVDPAAGVLEATASVSLIKFQDDVVVRITPLPTGSQIDVRSVSRVGISDLGVNAKRIRAFLADMK